MKLPLIFVKKNLFRLEIDINQLTNQKENKKDENEIEKQNINLSNFNQLTNINEKDENEIEIQNSDQKDVEIVRPFQLIIYKIHNLKKIINFTCASIWLFERKILSGRFSVYMAIE